MEFTFGSSDVSVHTVTSCLKETILMFPALGSLQLCRGHRDIQIIIAVWKGIGVYEKEYGYTVSGQSLSALGSGKALQR